MKGGRTTVRNCMELKTFKVLSISYSTYLEIYVEELTW